MVRIYGFHPYVVGSSPTSHIIYRYGEKDITQDYESWSLGSIPSVGVFTPKAQMDEQVVSTHKDAGSTPVWGVEKVKHGRVCSYHFLLILYKEVLQC